MTNRRDYSWMLVDDLCARSSGCNERCGCHEYRRCAMTVMMEIIVMTMSITTIAVVAMAAHGAR